MAQLDHDIAALHARIAEQDALLEARTATIVGLSAQLRELQGDGGQSASARVSAAERELAELKATKVVRYSAFPRRIYSMIRGGHG